MEGTPSRASALLLALLMFTSLPFVATGDTVIRSETVDLFPEGLFDNASEWAVSTQYGFTPGESAHWTEAMVTDGHLSFTHSRPQNIAEDTSWASSTPTDSNLSLGVPDGGYTWTKGPEIELAGFDLSAYYNNPLLNATLLVSFAIPETLQDDEVRIEMDWDGHIYLLQKFAHTQSAIDNMQGNPLAISLDSLTNWTWTELESVMITIDYASVGGIDDSEVQVDAVGIKVVYQSQWSGLDSGKAVHTTPLAMAPFHDYNLAEGTQNNLVTTSCGLETSSVGGGSGGWMTPALELPYAQTWGRIHMYGNASTSIEIQSSSDGVTWSEGVEHNDGTLISGSNYIRADIVIWDGCLSGVRIDFNDPTLYITGDISGNSDGLVANFSYLSIAVGSELVATQEMSVGSFQLSIPIGRFLPDEGGDLIIGVGARFYWSSLGVQETLVAQIEDITLSGGFVVEWDLDPTCERPADIYLDEDGIGSVVPFRNSCSDDITPTEQLVVSVTSSDESLVLATVSDGHLILSQQAEQSGIASVEIVTSDERGNQWSSIIDVIVSSVDDPPTYANLPLEVLVPVGDPVTVILDVADIDTDITNVSILTDTSWATIDEYRNLNLAPLSPGTFDVSISFSDGTTTYTEYLTILATADPDLVIEQVDYESDDMKVGSLIEIKVWVRNDGLSSASLVSVRCYNDQTLIDSANITHIEEGGLSSTSCFWQLPNEVGDTSLRVYVDPTHDILEVSESNNEYSTTIEILPADVSDGAGSSGNSEPILPSNMIWIISGIVILGAIIAMQLGPGKVRRNL
ncbi:MAG: CARDB domain-containing protein [Candidatus Thalassarchaeaceae archaeon]|nr:CARDB domain-containing protein [Candidatus Thalassarchaeaceae archaeon]